MFLVSVCIILQVYIFLMNPSFTLLVLPNVFVARLLYARRQVIYLSGVRFRIMSRGTLKGLYEFFGQMWGV